MRNPVNAGPLFSQASGDVKFPRRSCRIAPTWTNNSHLKGKWETTEIRPRHGALRTIIQAFHHRFPVISSKWENWETEPRFAGLHPPPYALGRWKPNCLVGFASTVPSLRLQSAPMTMSREHQIALFRRPNGPFSQTLILVVACGFWLPVLSHRTERRAVRRIGGAGAGQGVVTNNNRVRSSHRPISAQLNCIGRAHPRPGGLPLWPRFQGLDRPRAQA